MSHARIEEVSDSESDPSEGNISDLDSTDAFDERDILRTRSSVIPDNHDPDRILPPQLSSRTVSHAPAIPEAARAPPRAVPRAQQSSFQNQLRGPQVDADGTRFQSAVDEKKYKDFQCLYPIYFDASRSRAQGRRVGKELAVANPMAREIVTACGRLGLETLYEPTKCHPKDWANPGRVKVRVKNAPNSRVNNKHHLYIKIAEHLALHPTTSETAMRMLLPGMPPPPHDKPYPEPAVPKGWAMNRILPYHSAAMTGGGVSDNFFGDMMKEMGGELPAGMQGMQQMLEAPGPSGAAGGGGDGKPKKIKRKIIRA